MIKRNIQPVLEKFAKQYPVVTITGPRQSGKTILCKMTFPHKDYVSLEELDNRNFALEDPRGFLSQFNKGAIIDEVQRVPSLLSYIQTIVDEKNINGFFILTGSSQFELMSSITQSLAGRTALLKLLPFSLSEAYGQNKPDLDSILWTGFYPRIHNEKLNPNDALSFYFETYVQRDIRSLLEIKNLNSFERFVQLCAGRTGSILNLSNLANDCGISHNTARSWITLLEASYIVYLLKPHHANFNKRLIKSPKLYFFDVGFAANLLGIKTADQLKFHPLRGSLFETFVISELLKQRYNKGLRNNLFYFRDNTGHEIDVIIDNGDEIVPAEIKAGETISSDFFKNLIFYEKLNKKNMKEKVLIYAGEKKRVQNGVQVINYNSLDSLDFS